MSKKKNELRQFEVPITIDFDHKKVIGTAKIELNELYRALIGEGTYTFALGFVVENPEVEDDHVLFTDIELCEITLIPNFDPPKIKRKKKISDNNNNTNSI